MSREHAVCVEEIQSAVVAVGMLRVVGTHTTPSLSKAKPLGTPPVFTNTCQGDSSVRCPDSRKPSRVTAALCAHQSVHPPR